VMCLVVDERGIVVVVEEELREYSNSQTLSRSREWNYKLLFHSSIALNFMLENKLHSTVRLKALEISHQD
jgi:hypothetical protein